MPLPDPAAPSRRRLLALALGAGIAPGLLSCAHRGTRDDCFALGVASGCPRADSIVLWTRLALAAEPPARVEVRWELAADEAFRHILRQGTESAKAAWGHSLHVQVEGLEAARWYWYRFTALGQQSATGRTRTAPAADSLAPLSFAIASCQRWDHGFFSAWRHLADESPDLVVFLGDYIYEYPPLPGGVRSHQGLTGVRTLSQYRERYAQYKSDPDLQRMHASAPWIVTWDDHEVENDYAGDRSELLAAGFLKRRAAAYQAWWEHMPLPPSMRPRGPSLPLFSRHDWGALARFHVLDDRQHRDPQACPRPHQGGSNTVRDADCPERALPARSLLGAAQERWLGESLGLGGVHWNLLAQQTLMAPFDWGAPPSHWTDGWDGYPAARERLLDTLVQRRVRNPVVLGGDVHANYVADLKRRPDGPTLATEFCGTSISSRGMAQARVDAALPFNPHILYGRSEDRGYVGFRLDAQALRATLRVVSDARDPAASVRSAARFEVESGRPGAHRAG